MTGTLSGGRRADRPKDLGKASLDPQERELERR